MDSEKTEKQDKKINEATEREKPKQQNNVDSGSVNLETPLKESPKKKKIILVSNPHSTEFKKKNLQVNRPISRPLDRNVLETQKGQQDIDSSGENQKSDVEKNFNKYICFANIRELLKGSAVKIGQIEKEAGCQLGYMSRLEKPGTSNEPSAEFIVTAAKMLNASLDTLITVNLAEMTPTERYLVSFFEKLQKDTIADKLGWMIETADNLANLEADMNGYVDHPLFGYETFYEEGETEYPEEVSRIVFVSDSFGPRTAINGDCYHLKLKGGSVLYLMDICKSFYHVGEPDTLAKEIWMFTPGNGVQMLANSRGTSPLSPMVNALVSTVAERMKHPRVKKEVKSVIDAFMQDDFGSEDEELPFA